LTRLQGLFSSQGKEKTQSQKSTEPASANESQAPLRHLAIIMDGNGRWATQRHLPRLAGHKAGVEALKRIVECARDEHIEMLSVYVFSTENWTRPKAEVDGLMRLLWETLRLELMQLHKDGVRLRHLGRLSNLPSELQRAIGDSIELTKKIQ